MRKKSPVCSEKSPMYSELALGPGTRCERRASNESSNSWLRHSIEHETPEEIAIIKKSKETEKTTTTEIEKNETGKKEGKKRIVKQFASHSLQEDSPTEIEKEETK